MHGSDVTDEDFKEYIKLVANVGNLVIVRWFLSDPKFPHGENDGFSALIKAVESGDMDTVRWILDEYATTSGDELYLAAHMAQALGGRSSTS